LNRAIFLDRDGVINKALVRNSLPHPPHSLSEVVVISGVSEAIKMLKENSFEIVVVTNQPDVSRNQISKESVVGINQFLGNQLGIEHFYTCFHDDSDFCDCRKPRIGLFLQAKKDLKLNLESSFMVGDRWRDIEAGQTAGCTCFYVQYGYEEKHPDPPYFGVTSLLDAAMKILEMK
jgi:D-glycero-D-manno-heptose 1,7-bisphosphate phosphatase